MAAVTVDVSQGFFVNDSVTPATVSDLLSAVEAALTNLSGAIAAETAAQASATAASGSASAAAASASSATTSATNSSTSASAAATSATNASTSASGASTSATNASSSATSASTSASSASSNATSAGTSATNAGNSASAAASSASAAATSATNAASSATTAATTLANKLDMATATAQAITSQVTVNGALIAAASVALSPANNNVVLSPTGTGVVTISPATAGAMNNMAVGGTTPLAGNFTTLGATGLFTPSTTNGIKGTTAADSANAGSVGEIISALCPGTSTTVTISQASPGVVSWTGHGIIGVGALQFTTTGSLPTGLTAGTQYYAVPINANSFNVASSVANALAGSFINTTSAGSGVQTAYSYGIATTSNDICGITLTPGDYDVWGVVGTIYSGGTIAAQSGWINTTSKTLPSPSDALASALNQVIGISNTSGMVISTGTARINVSTNTTVFLSGTSNGTNTGQYGSIQARRRR